MQSHSIKSELAKHSFFKGIAPDFLNQIQECASVRTFELNDIIFYEGAEADHFYLILDGRVAIQVFGGELGFIDIEELSSGQIIGWSWLIPPYQWHFTAKSLTHTTVVEFNGKPLRSLCQNNSDFGYDMLKRLMILAAERVAETRQKLIENYCA